MAYTLPTYIGTRDLQNLAVIKHYGILHLLNEVGFFRRAQQWIQKYIVICKGNSSKYDWNLCCFSGCFAEKSEKNYLMTEFESVKEYDVTKDNINIIGFIIKFEEPTKAPLIFRCDTEATRKIWIGHVGEAIIEVHKDSGYSSDSNRQSKKYDTIDNIDNQSSDSDTDDLVNIPITSQTWQREAELATAEAYNDTYLEFDDTHCYENMEAENNTFKKFVRSKSFAVGERTAAKRHEQKERGHMCLPPVQETKGAKTSTIPKRSMSVLDTKQNVKNNSAEMKLRQGSLKNIGLSGRLNIDPSGAPRERKTKKGQPKRKHSLASSRPVMESGPIYVNTTDNLMGMENLKLDISSHRNDSLSQTDSNVIDRDITKREPHHMKLIQRGEMNEGVIRELKSKIEKRVILDEPSINGHNKTVKKVNVHQSNEHFASSQDFDSFQSSSPSNDNGHTNVKVPFASTDISSNDNDHTNVKVPFASSEFSPVRGAHILCEVIPAESLSESARSCETKSYVSVSGDKTSSSSTTRRYCSESFASVRSGTVHSKTANAVTRNGCSTTEDVDSFSSNNRATSCSSETCVKTLAFPQSHIAHSAILPRTTRPYILNKDNSSLSEETISFVSVNTHETCSSVLKSASVLANPNNKSIQVLRNAAAETNSAAFPEASLEWPVEDDGAAIYENTDIFCTTLNNQKESESRRSSNSSSIHSSNSSGSVSSRDSDTLSSTYESPDENALYVNIKHFQREDYFCEEKRNAKRNLTKKAVGTFQVCKGKSGKELCVVTPKGVKQFRIYERSFFKLDGTYSLFKDFSRGVFSSLDYLLSCYSINDLPSQEYKVNLVKGYKAQEQEDD